MASIPLNALRTFEAVASRLSFAKGAEALNVSPAAVSSQIRSLEQRLNQPLFHRHGRHITLTETGRKLLPGVQRGLAELRRAVQTVSQDRSEGVLNVSMMPTFLQKWLMPRLTEFYNVQPQIDLRINADNTPGQLRAQRFSRGDPLRHRQVAGRESRENAGRLDPAGVQPAPVAGDRTGAVDTRNCSSTTCCSSKAKSGTPGSGCWVRAAGKAAGPC